MVVHSSLCATLAPTWKILDFAHVATNQIPRLAPVALEQATGAGNAHQILKIYEVYLFRRSYPDSNTLFAEYADSVLKARQESSDLSNWIRIRSDHQRSLDDYQRLEGIALDAERIFKNPVKCSMTKTRLNSFWGKFVLKFYHLHHHVNGLPALFSSLTNTTQDIKGFHMVIANPFC